MPVLIIPFYTICTCYQNGIPMSSATSSTTPSPRPNYERCEPVMKQIHTVVYLMLENRSLDNVLGWLYENDKPAVVVPPGSSPDYDGLNANLSNSYRGKAYHPSVGTSARKQPLRMPPFDPNEPMANVLCQLYADDEGNLPNGEPCRGKKGSKGPR